MTTPLPKASWQSSVFGVRFSAFGCVVVGMFNSALTALAEQDDYFNSIRRERTPNPNSPTIPTPRSANTLGSGTVMATSSNCTVGSTTIAPKSRLKKNETKLRIGSGPTWNVCGTKGSKRLPGGPAKVKEALWYGFNPIPKLT